MRILKSIRHIIKSAEGLYCMALLELLVTTIAFAITQNIAYRNIRLGIFYAMLAVVFVKLIRTVQR